MSYNDNGPIIKAISAIVASALTAGIVCAVQGCNDIENNAAIVLQSEENNTDNKKKFKAGEHIISTNIDLDKNKICQIPYHDGYRLNGISIDSDASIAIYTNIEDVWCVSQGKDENNNDVFNEFGELDFYKESTDYFEVGEHTLAIPISNPSKNNLQYKFQEGYEVIDVAAYVSGKYETFGCGYIIYANTVEINCDSNNKDNFNEFGEAISNQKVKKLR